MQGMIKAELFPLSQKTKKMGLMTSVAFIALIQFGSASIAIAQTSAPQTINFNIRSQDMGSALIAFSERAGLKLLIQSNMIADKRSPSIQGNLTRDQALRQLLSGSNLHYYIQGSTLTISNPSDNEQNTAAPDGSLLLNTITVSNAAAVAIDAPYHTAAPAAYISEQNIERFRGSSPADIFRGTPGVSSGESRNGAGSIDVNIRGMQGMGRVATTIDGAENAVNVYQGYQGISNRTFVDPDFLGGIDILKGSDAASSGIAGTVAMRTLEAGDIVKEGNRFGLRVKGGFGTNSSKPVAGTKAGYLIANKGYSGPQNPNLDPYYHSTAESSDATMNRPAFLKPTNGSGSIVAAMQDENIELLAGYAYRKRGNYHAGKNGPAAEAIDRGGMVACLYYCDNPSNHHWFPNFIENTGIANYRAGEQVLNTELETKSTLLKGKVMFGDGHSIQLGYTGFSSEAGDRMASNFKGLNQQAVQQALTTDVDAHTGTFKYRWDPTENDLINLKANLWGTKLKQRSPTAYGGSNNPPPNFKSGPDLWTWGGDISNRSQFETDFGGFDVTIGGSYKLESTKPSADTKKYDSWLDLRDGKREEAAAFIKTAYKPTDWLTINGGLRYSSMWSRDRSSMHMDHPDMVYGKARLKQDGWSPSLGVTVTPFEGTQLYANYSSTLRAPSIMEAVSAFNMTVNEDTRAERASNWEIGANFIHDNIFADDDRTMVKIGYFNWDIKDYIAREFRIYANSQNVGIRNIDRARFAGLELSANYSVGGFEATLSANYYLNIEFCRNADSCENKSLYADYATNQMPPKYGIDLTLSQKMLEDALTVGGRISYTSSRAVGHGDVTGQGMSQFITLIDWKPYTLVDVFAEYKINDNYTASLRIENLTDRYYVDPLSLVLQPGPGRTFYASLTANF